MNSVAWPGHLLTLDEWERLPENGLPRLELVEGSLLVTPRPGPRHQLAVSRLCAQIDDQLPDELTAVAAVEVVIDAGFPPTVRVPDIVVVPNAVAERNPPRFEAADVLLAVEIMSPGTRGTDRVTKPAEYADAGIPHYWLVDLDEPATLTGHVLVDGSYEDAIATVGRVEVTEPAPLSIDVPSLLARR